MVQTFINVVLLLSAMAAALLVMVVLTEIMLAAFGRLRKSAGILGNPPPGRIAVLVPAHDEALGIHETLEDLLPQLKTGDRVIVIADNCTDRTADIAASLGVEVLVRHDPAQRGKGYALDFGVSHLRQNPPDVVVILDADCRILDQGLQKLGAACLRSRRPVQSRYDLLLPGQGASFGLRIGALAWRVKTYLRPLGLKALGLPCQLMGTGMAFPWHTIAAADLKTGHLVEDMVLGLSLTCQGQAPIFEPDILTVSPFPVSREGQTSQRTRWETGHLQVITGLVPGLLRDAVRTRNAGLFALAVDAAVPPLGLLAFAIGVMCLVCGLWSAAGGATLPLLVAISALTGLIVAVGSAWWWVGRSVVSFQDMLRIPLYVLSKLTIYARALSGQRLDWIRSKRT